ncbi:DUF5088 domain-containing protein [Encephalitozoon intestinalis]
MFLFDGKKISVKKVSDEMKSRVRKGMCYKNDWILIQEDEDGIVFKVIEPRAYSYASLFKKKFDSDAYLTIRGNEGPVGSGLSEKTIPKDPSKPEQSPASVVPEELPERILLPFLNDTLPYSVLEIPVMNKDLLNGQKVKSNELVLPDSFNPVDVNRWNNRSSRLSPIIGRVIYKTRMSSVTYTRKYPYYFFILQTSRLNIIKVFVWGEDLPYSSMKVGDKICLSKCRKKPNIEGPSIVEHNRFTEARYFRCKEVSAKEIFRIELNEPKEAFKSIFSDASGKVEYLSVLNRRCSGFLEEYYLIRMGKHKILLFYNSSKEFHEIEVGKHVRITNLRISRRGRSEFYISTIYTQIEFSDGISSPLVIQDGDIVSKLDDEGKDTRKRSKMATNFEESEDEDNFLEKKENSSFQCNLIFGAMGYVPDDFSNIEEMYLSRKEEISGEMCEIVPFMPPLEINLKDIYDEAEKLMLNESKKFIVDGMLVDVDFSNFIFDEPPTLMDGTSVTYFCNGALTHQLPGYVSICNEITIVVYLFNNFWMDEFDLESLYKLGGCSSLEELKSMRGREMKFVIDAFRASEETVIFCLTKVFK